MGDIDWQARALAAEQECARLRAELEAVRGAGGAMTRQKCAELLAPLYPSSNLTVEDVESRDGLA
jgi:hypothetical protein